MIRALAALALLPLLTGCFGSGPEEPAVEPTPSQLYCAVALQELEAGRPVAAMVELEKALSTAELLDDRVGQAACWNNLGLVHRALGALAEEAGDAAPGETSPWRRALTCHERALHLHRDPAARARTLEHLATAHLALGELAKARERVDAAAALREAVGDPRGLAAGLVVRAAIAAAEGDLDRALALDTEALRLAGTTGARALRAAALANAAAVHRRAGRLDVARAALEEALVLDRERASPRAIAGSLSALRAVAEEQGDQEAFADYALREAALRLRLAEDQQLSGGPVTQARIASGILRSVEDCGITEREAHAAAELRRLRAILGGIISPSAP